MPGQKSTHAVMQSRIRDNQRRSRARQKEYIHELEEKVQTCERLGVQASLEIQQAARNVLEENKRLRALLLSRDLGGGGLEGGGGGAGAGRQSLSSEAIYLQEKLERYGSCPRVVGEDQETIGQPPGKGQQMPLSPLQRNMSKPAPSSSSLPSRIVACCGGGGSGSTCGIPMSPANAADADMRETILQEGKVASILPPRINSAPSPLEAPLSAISPREVSLPTEVQAISNTRPIEMSLPLTQTSMSASSGCCGPNTTCVPSLQSPDVAMAKAAPVHEAELSAIEHIKPSHGEMLTLSSLSDPDLRTELDPETDTSSCAFAISIIAGMRSDVDLDDVKQALGCRGNNLNECIIENSRLFAAVDQFAE